MEFPGAEKQPWDHAAQWGRDASEQRCASCASLFRRLSAFFGSAPDQGPKAAKYAVLTPGHAGFPNRAKRSEGSDTTPTWNARVSACEPLCARFGAGVACVPAAVLNSDLVAKALGIAPSSAYELMHEKNFPTLRIGSRMVVPKEKFIQWVEEHTKGGERV